LTSLPAPDFSIEAVAPTLSSIALAEMSVRCHAVAYQRRRKVIVRRSWPKFGTDENASEVDAFEAQKIVEATGSNSHFGR
jgi:hypothetical protein